MSTYPTMREEDLLRSIVASASDAIVCKDTRGIIVSWNPGAERLFGHRADEVLGRSIQLLIPPDRLAEETMILDRILQGERVDCLETERCHRDGSLLPVSGTVSPVLDAQGVVTGASKIARPIEHLLQARRREQQFAQIVRSASDGILVVDTDGRIEFANPAALSIFGWLLSDLVGASLDVLLPPQVRGPHAQWMKSLDGTDALPRHMGQAGRLVQAMHQDGSIVPVEITISAFGEAARPRRMAVVRDRRPLQEAARLHDAALKAEADSEAKSRFIARMSHELRTPLTVVLGFTELLQADPATATERARGLVTHIRSAGLHLPTLIDDLLDAARIERGMLHLVTQPVPLQALLEDLQSQVNVVARITRQQVELLPVPPGACVQADPIRLRQVLYNLLSNALKYSPPGSTVTLQVSAHDQGWRIDVTDRGIGIEPDRLDKLFKPYERLGREFSGVPGVGLGLATVRELIDAMAGDVAVYSAPGHGSTFSVMLAGAPAADAPPADASTSPELHFAHGPMAPEASFRPLAGKRLLCVDDNPMNRLLIDAALTDMPGLTPSFAVDGQSARRELEVARPDLVLLDLMLPDAHGLDWLRTLRGDPRFADLQVVLFTADNDPATRQEARDLDVDELVSKPFDIFTLQQQVRRLLQ